MIFSFGRNWQQFLQKLNHERFRHAEESLTEFLGLPHLGGYTFLDIGCGSGLFSYAAYNLGAERVLSFDVDPFSVECCRHLRRQANAPQNWQIQEGSILDAEFIADLGRFDIVYSWGVLHHTGDMWQAIRNAAALVNGGGLFYIAIYNNVKGYLGSEFWVKAKRLYNRVPAVGKRGMEIAYMGAYLAKCLARFENPVSHIRNYKSERGMSWRTDVIDWLGGYPYEYASTKEIVEFMRQNSPEFKPKRITTADGLGNNYYLFERCREQDSHRCGAESGVGIQS